MRKSILVGDRAHFAHRSDGKDRPLLEHWYGVLLPDCDPRLLGEGDGLAITQVGASDGILTAVSLEGGHHALVHRDLIRPDWEAVGSIHVTCSDNPAVTFAMWNGSDLPTPIRKASSGRQAWEIPGIGRVFLYYNEKKEDMNYEPDVLRIDNVQGFFQRFGGYPIVLDPTEREAFSLNDFFSQNRLYQLGDGRGQFARHFIGDISKLSLEKRQERWDRTMDPAEAIKCLPMLAWDLHRPIRVVTRKDNDNFVRGVPIYGAPVVG